MSEPARAVACATCGRAYPVEAANGLNAAALSLATLGAHTGSCHSPHALSITPALPEGPHTLSLTCLAPGCNGRPLAVTVRTPLELAAVHAITFHSYHEGHTLRIELDGHVLHDAWRDREGRPIEGEPQRWSE